MRHVFSAAAIGTATLLLACGVATAAPAATHRAGPPAKSGSARAALASPRAVSLRCQPRFVPAPLALGSAATATLDGTVQDYYGSPLAGATTQWWIENSQSGGKGTADAGGHYSFSGVPTTTASGAVRADSSDGKLAMAWWGLGWTSAGPNTFDLRPGAVHVDSVSGGPWSEWIDGLTTEVYTAADTQGKYATQSFSSFSAQAPALPGTIDAMAAYFFGDEGVELTDAVGRPVTAGTTIDQTATADESNAQRVWTGGNSDQFDTPWASGKPGSKLKLWLQGFPTTWTNQIIGWSSAPSGAGYHEFGDYPSQGATKHARTLTVPKAAVPGYAYHLSVTHTNGPLSLSTWFQICTLKASKTSVRKGASIRFSGVIPVQDHVGTTAGTRTKVYIWVHKGTAAQPAKLDPRSQGWRQLGYVKSDGYGKFKTPALKAKSTVTVVAEYLGDDWYYPAFTSPVKIRVR
jgi:hypothetical protein